MDSPSSSTTPKSPKPRWYAATPAKFLFAVLVMQGILFLSAHYRWFWFNERKGYTVLITVAATAIALLFLVAVVLVSRFFKSKSQFSLATLLLMVPVMAIPCAWLGREQQQARRQRTLVMLIDAHNGAVTYAEDWEGSDVDDWLELANMGRDFFREIDEVFLGTDTDPLSQVHPFLRLRELVLDNIQATDAELRDLQALKQVKILHLANCRVTDAGLEHLKGLSQLRKLNLNATRVTDAGLVHLSRLTHLQALYLNRTEVTDSGLEHLKGLKQLRYIDLRKTQVTDAGVKRLKETLPDCRFAR